MHAHRRLRGRVATTLAGVTTLSSLLVGCGTPAAPKSQTTASPSQSAAAIGPTQTELVRALSTCNIAPAELNGVSLGDEDHTLTLDGKGSEDTTGAELNDMVCIFQPVKMPDAVTAQMDNTRALDAQQTATWDRFQARWTYHPDNGFDVILTETPV
jgi:hypothetical protein